jgi:hypothetical protein
MRNPFERKRYSERFLKTDYYSMAAEFLSSGVITPMAA